MELMWVSSEYRKALSLIETPLSSYYWHFDIFQQSYRMPTHHITHEPPLQGLTCLPAYFHTHFLTFLLVKINGIIVTRMKIKRRDKQQWSCDTRHPWTQPPNQCRTVITGWGGTVPALCWFPLRLRFRVFAYPHLFSPGTTLAFAPAALGCNIPDWEG